MGLVIVAIAERSEPHRKKYRAKIPADITKEATARYLFT